VLKRQFSGSKNLWLMRLYYFFYYCGMGAISPFINLFYIQRHLSGTEIGVLGTISALVGLLSAPFWGRLNDSIRRPRLLLQITLFVNSLAYYYLSKQSAFLEMAVIIGVNALICSSVNPQSQAQALEAAAGADSYYGSIRLFGSLGWAVMALLSGLIIQKTSLLSGFYLFGFFTILAALVLFIIHPPGQKDPRQLPVEKPARLPMKQVLLEMVKNRELLVFAVALIVMWTASNGTTTFESVYMQQLGASTSLIGWANTVGAGCEIPMMLVADRVLRRKGSTATLLAGFFSYVVAFSIIVIHPSVASFFIYRAINGTSMGLYAVAFTYFIVERTPAQQTGTMLALYSVTIAGMFSILVSPLSGRLFDLIGAYWLYVIALAGYIIAALIIYFGVLRKFEPKNNYLK